MFRAGMHMLAGDPETNTLLLVSKSPTPAGVEAIAGDLPDGVRIVAAFVGWDGAPAPFEVHPTLEAAAAAAAGTAPADIADLQLAVDAREGIASGRSLLGLDSGGSRATRVTGRRVWTAVTRCSTSARPNTPRAVRTRWSTSTCVPRCLS